MSYFLEWLKIDLKANLEFKTNLFSHFGIVLVDTIITIFSFTILRKNFDFFVLTEVQILYFVLNMYFMWLLIGSTAMSKRLHYYLLRGDLNIYLIRPSNVFSQYFFKTTRSRRFISAFFMFIAILFYIFYYEVNFLKFLLTLGFSLFGGILYLVIICFFDSFAFFMKKGNFLFNIFKSSNDSIQYFPFSFLENYKYSQFLLLFPVLFFGSVVTEYLFGYRSFNEIIEICIFLSYFMLVLPLLTYFLWKVGLKNYEGFN